QGSTDAAPSARRIDHEVIDMQMRPARQSVNGPHAHYPDNLPIIERGYKLIARMRLAADSLYEFGFFKGPKLSDDRVCVHPFRRR
ncbi:hypothetical protein QMN58_26175, partial [Escherichia coli]|nr:hypothetical protein [Escherichia coli]